MLIAYDPSSATDLPPSRCWLDHHLGGSPYRVMESEEGLASNRAWMETLQASSERTRRDIEDITTTLAVMRRESQEALQRLEHRVSDNQVPSHDRPNLTTRRCHHNEGQEDGMRVTTRCLADGVEVIETTLGSPTTVRVVKAIDRKSVV